MFFHVNLIQQFAVETGIVKIGNMGSDNVKNLDELETPHESISCRYILRAKFMVFAQNV